MNYEIQNVIQLFIIIFIVKYYFTFFLNCKDNSKGDNVMKLFSYFWDAFSFSISKSSWYLSNVNG